MRRGVAVLAGYMFGVAVAVTCGAIAITGLVAVWKGMIWVWRWSP